MLSHPSKVLHVWSSTTTNTVFSNDELESSTAVAWDHPTNNDDLRDRGGRRLQAPPPQQQPVAPNKTQGDPKQKGHGAPHNWPVAH
jgi:hypothetical protein